MSYSLIILKFVLYAFGAYMVSQIIEYILDKFAKKLRFDKWILYLLVTKSLFIKTKVSYTSASRPDINQLKKQIENNFKEGLDTNEKPKGNYYVFKIKLHPTTFKLMIIEPSDSKLFTITLETYNQERLPKIFMNSFNKTIHVFERVNNILEEFKLKTITSQIEITQITGEESAMNCNYKTYNLSSKGIQINSTTFSNVNSIIKDCLREWRVTFL